MHCDFIFWIWNIWTLTAAASDLRTEPSEDSTLTAPQLSPSKAPDSPDFGSSSTNPFEQDSLSGSIGENETEYFSLVHAGNNDDPFPDQADNRRQSLSTNAIKRLSQESAVSSISPLEAFQNISGNDLTDYNYI